MRLSRTFPPRRWALIAVATLAGTLLGLPAAVAQTADGVCDDVLLTVSPTSISGDETAVAITSQQLEADVPGWTQVSWEAAEDTTLTGVTVRTEEQTFTLIDDIASGTVEDALELTFCGSTGSAAPDGEADDETGNDADDGDADGDTQVTQPVDDVCDDVLVTITPDATFGDETAVAITSQQLDADVVGWVSVSWEAAADTTLTGVTVRTASGTATLIDELETGTVEDALELTFCGTVAAGDDTDPEGDADPGDDTSDDDLTEVPEPEPGTDRGSDGSTGGGGTTGGGNATGGSGGSASDGTEAGGSGGGTTTSAPSDEDDADTTQEPEPEPEPEREPEPTPEPAEDAEENDAEENDAEDNDAAAQDDETEVLGVQLSQDDDGSGWLVPVLVILLVAGAIGAGFLVRNRYLATSGGRS